MCIRDRGKTTLLKIAKGVLQPDGGSAEIYDRMRGRWVPARQCADIIATLPQDLDAFFVKDTVFEELRCAFPDKQATPEEVDRHVRESAHAIGITPHLGKDPHELSCGERRLVAIAKAVMAEVGILILDEPTMGVDPFAQRKLGKLLHELAKRGVTVLIASQDLKFCAEYATNVSLLFNGCLLYTSRCVYETGRRLRSSRRALARARGTPASSGCSELRSSGTPGIRLRAPWSRG